MLHTYTDSRTLIHNFSIQFNGLQHHYFKASLSQAQLLKD